MWKWTENRHRTIEIENNTFLVRISYIYNFNLHIFVFLFQFSRWCFFHIQLQCPKSQIDHHEIYDDQFVYGILAETFRSIALMHFLQMLWTKITIKSIFLSFACVKILNSYRIYLSKNNERSLWWFLIASDFVLLFLYIFFILFPS